MATTSTGLPGPVTAASGGETRKNSTKVVSIKAKNNDCQTRHAVRVLIQKIIDEIIVLSAKKDNYYELPGIGIDDGEDHQTPVEREVMEETG